MSSDFRFSPRPNKAHLIAWREWGEAAFQEAEQQGKPVLLSISAVWCHWCHVMDETSYSDDENIRLLNEGYVPIRVDNDRRPDINIRYNMGGWPTTAFLTPEGEVLVGATYLPPEKLREALAQVGDYYARNQAEVRQRAQQLREQRQAAVAAAPQVTEIGNTVTFDVVQAIQARFDATYGGFGTEPKFPMVDSIGLLLDVYRNTRELRLLLTVTTTLDQMRSGGIHDRVEHGFFRYSTTRDWAVPHYEKMLEGNAGLLGNYLDAFQVTRDAAYRETVRGIISYLDTALSDPQSGAFYGSQDADEHYYTLVAAERARTAAPGTDKTLYVNWNALATSQYLRAGWMLSEEGYMERALRALDFLWERCRHPEQGMYHFYDGMPRVTGLLTDQLTMARACLDAFEVSGRRAYRDRALELAEVILRDYQDPRGGFFDVRDALQPVGKLQHRDKAIGENGEGAALFARLFHHTERTAYRAAADSALRAFADSYQQYGDFAAGYARAWLWLRRQPLQAHIVGDPADARTRALLWSAHGLPEMVKSLEVVDPARDAERLEELGYPPSPAPAAYVCFSGACSAPVTDPAALEATFQGLNQPLKSL
ncbi:MAG: thioredoxin domain-containing protein [Chloroflexi bacterium]|nr:thioredoxin domain-containing protein [Chloroflexota bacterium]